MAFKDQLASFTAADIIATLGCPRGTAYDWLEGRRQPPEWQQRHWLSILRSTKPNPASQQTRRKRREK